jgi:hypothetical protein
MPLNRRRLAGLSAAAVLGPFVGRIDALAQEATPEAAAGPLTIYLLTIRGTLAAATIEETRTLHNGTAGAPQSVAAAQSLGDVSHMVYAPTTPPASGAGEILFMDLWTSIDGLNQFFANPAVQQQAGQLFTQRDPVVWTAAAGFTSYHLPAPHGHNDRFVVLVRGPVASMASAMTAHNAVVGGGIGTARKASSLSHDVYSRVVAPGDAASLELLAVDLWSDAEEMTAYYANPAFQAAVLQIFSAAPDTSIWTDAPGEWAEW